MPIKRSRLLQASLVLSILFTPTAVQANSQEQLTHGEHRELQKLTHMNGGTIQICWDEKRDTPQFIGGRLSKPLQGEPIDKAYQFLNTVKELYHFDKAKKSFQLKKVDVDQFGMTHIRLTHVVNNIPVWGDELIVHIDKKGVVRSVNGEFTKDIEKNTERIGQPQVTSQQAVQKALQDLKINKPDQQPSVALYYFPYPEPDIVTLAYVVTIVDKKEPAEWKVFVDAVSGEVVHKYNNLKFKP